MDCYIIGSGGFAKEVLRLLLDTGKAYTFKGFIDYRPKIDTIKADGKDYPVLDEDVFLQQGGRDNPLTNVFIGIGDPAKIMEVIGKYKGFSFPNLIHPSFVGSPESITMGEGNLITAGCVFTVDIHIGSFNIFNLNTTIGHDAVIGSYNVLNPGVAVSGGVQLGDGILLGANATVLQYISIGSNSVLGAGAVLTKALPPQSLAVGVPARIVKTL